MKVLPEYFDPSQFIVPQYDTHFTIKRPYTNFAKSMRLLYLSQIHIPVCKPFPAT